MSAIADLDDRCPSATDGEIAAINLESARRRAWARFAQDPQRPGVAEEILDNERLVAQFLGDLDALDRLDELASQFVGVDDSSRAALVQAEVASTVHRFDDARGHLARAELMGGAREAIERHSLAIDQACGVELDNVLAARRRIATASGRLEDLVPLGAVLADLECFAEADAVYRQAFYSYYGISPFPLAWVCFQLGMLWGELVPVPDPDLAALWYRRAIAYLPGYVKARVHLAEIYASQDRDGRGGDAAPAGAFEPRSGGPVASGRRDGRAGRGSKRPRRSSTPHGSGSMSFLGDTRSPSRTMPRSSTPAAATTAGGRSNSRARMSRIVRHAVPSSRPMRSR